MRRPRLPVLSRRLLALRARSSHNALFGIAPVLLRRTPASLPPFQSRRWRDPSHRRSPRARHRWLPPRPPQSLRSFPPLPNSCHVSCFLPQRSFLTHRRSYRASPKESPRHCPGAGETVAGICLLMKDLLRPSSQRKLQTRWPG